jgi:hypothetical protein
LPTALMSVPLILLIAAYETTQRTQPCLKYALALT